MGFPETSGGSEAVCVILKTAGFMFGTWILTELDCFFFALGHKLKPQTENAKRPIGCPYITKGRTNLVLNLVRTFRMEEFIRTETQPSRACCSDPTLYPPITHLLCYGRIESESIENILYNISINIGTWTKLSETSRMQYNRNRSSTQYRSHWRGITPGNVLTWLVVETA